jgi:hypothetical protein
LSRFDFQQQKEKINPVYQPYFTPGINLFHETCDYRLVIIGSGGGLRPYVNFLFAFLLINGSA